MRKAFAILCLLIVPLAGLAQNRSSFINGLTHDNHSLACDLPGKEHIKNIGSRIDGAGMCVFSSLEMAALYQGLEQMRGYRNWCAEKFRGGGWPEKVDSTLAAWFKAKNIQPIPYLNASGLNAAKATNLLELCDRTGRMACITYGYSPRYGGSVQHMTNAPMFRGSFGVCLDNNFPGEDKYEWMPKEELVRRTIYPNRSAWIFVWLTAPPPPSPRN